MKFHNVIILAFITALCLSVNLVFSESKYNSRANTLEDDKGLQELGRHLFFERRLSFNCTKSCASCHTPQLAFSDGYRRSIGASGDILAANSPSLLNLVHANKNEIINKIEKRLDLPLFRNKPLEMGAHLAQADILNALNTSKVYQSLLKETRSSTELSWLLIKKALAHYIAALAARESLYDLVQKRPHQYALSTLQEKGRKLFFSDKLGCGNCHGGLDFRSGKIVRVQPLNLLRWQKNAILLGLKLEYEQSHPIDKELISAKSRSYREVERVRQIQVSQLSDYKLLPNTRIYSVPSLRNVALTAPYLQDGSLDTLTQVIKTKVAAKKISNEEIAAVIEFLHTLTDDSYLDDSHFIATGSSGLCE